MSATEQATFGRRASWVVSDTMLITWRNLIHYVRVPQLIAFAVVQPIMFTLLFAFVFGGAIKTPNGNYIDYLIPGLIGLNLLGTGMWGIGFAIANWRQQRLLRRLIATPMRRSDFLLALLLARLLWLVLEVGIILAFGALVFGTAVRGSWLAFVLVTLIGTLTFSAIGLLVAVRARSIEAVSGLMNVVQLPMWLLSGTFFSSERFPAVIQPLVQALPLTLVNNSLRAIMNESAGLATVAPAAALLAAWGLVSFFAALKWFRWD